MKNYQGLIETYGKAAGIHFFQ